MSRRRAQGIHRTVAGRFGKGIEERVSRRAREPRTAFTQEEQPLSTGEALPPEPGDAQRAGLTEDCDPRVIGARTGRQAFTRSVAGPQERIDLGRMQSPALACA